MIYIHKIEKKYRKKKMKRRFMIISLMKIKIKMKKERKLVIKRDRIQMNSGLNEK